MVSSLLFFLKGMQKMNKVIFPAAFALSVLISLSGAGETDAQETLPIGYQLADLKAGGLLYDNWLKLKGIKINNTHPMFPDDKKKNGVTSWRCKECHGWDYLGKEGCYHDNHVYYVGIKGVYDVRNRSPEELYFAIADRDEHHDFKKYLRLSASDIWSLVKFIREGLVDFRKVMNGRTGRRSRRRVGGKRRPAGDTPQDPLGPSRYGYAFCNYR
jgi:hypothetical protein